MLRFELKSALRSLSLRPLQTGLSILGVMVGVAAVVAMLAVGEGAKRRALQEVERVGFNNVLIRAFNLSARGDEQLKLSDVTRIERSLPTVATALPVREGSAPSGSRTIPLLGTTEKAQAILNLKLSDGRFLTPTDVAQKRAVAVLGAELASKLGPSAYVGGDILLKGTPFHIVGLLSPDAASTLVGPAQNVAFLPLGVGTLEGLSDIVVHLKKGADLPLVKRQLEHLLGSTHHNAEFQVTIPLEVMKQRTKVERTFNSVLAAVALVSLLVGGIGVANIMLATVSTRMREVGIRRAIGATRRHILRQFLSEALVLTTAGAVMGLFLGIGAAKLVGYLAGWETLVTFWSCFAALIISIGVGLLSGLYPAIKASKLSCVAALRSL